MKQGIGQMRGRRGFTLIELLVVITIIGILVSLITMAVFKALQFAERSGMYGEITKMHSAMETFKTEFGAYPPDGTGGNERLRRFVRTAFPGAMKSGKGAQLPSEVAEGETGPAKALVYWLSELNKDKRNPFRRETATGTNKNDTKQIFYTFDESRIRNGMYYPKDYDVQKDPPYVYFEALGPYDRASFKYMDVPFKPYNKGQSSNQSGRSGGNQMDWYMPDSFQIICGGLDKRLGTGGTLTLENAAATASNSMISKDDEDNIVNFDSRAVGDIR